MADTPSNCSPKTTSCFICLSTHRFTRGQQLDMIYMQWAPRAWEDPSTLPSIAKEAPIEVEHNPSTGNSEEDRPGEDESSRKKRRRHEERKPDRREKHHSHSRRKRKKDMERRRHDSDSN